MLFGRFHNSSIIKKGPLTSGGLQPRHLAKMTKLISLFLSWLLFFSLETHASFCGNYRFFTAFFSLLIIVLHTVECCAHKKPIWRQKRKNMEDSHLSRQPCHRAWGDGFTPRWHGEDNRLPTWCREDLPSVWGSLYSSVNLCRLSYRKSNYCSDMKVIFVKFCTRPTP